MNDTEIMFELAASMLLVWSIHNFKKIYCELVTKS